MLEQEPFAGDNVIQCGTLVDWCGEQIVTFSNQNILPWIRLNNKSSYVLVLSSESRISLTGNFIVAYLKVAVGLAFIFMRTTEYAVMFIFLQFNVYLRVLIVLYCSNLVSCNIC